MRLVYFLFVFFIISSCGGGSQSSNAEIEESNEISFGQSCSPYQSNIGNGSTFYCRIEHDNIDREFYVYIGSAYQNNSPILFSLHGYTSRGLWNMNYTGFQSIADDDGFIVIYPQGTLLPATGQTHWNVGGWTTSSQTDDVDFINTVISFIDDEYSIDSKRIYSTGMSNGGYMSYHLACNLSEKVAAIASVTGSMTPETYSDCNPNHPTAIMQIHGDIDTVVPYFGNWRSRSIPTVMEYWEEFNDCQIETLSTVPDVNNDGDGGLLFSYDQCLANVKAQLYLMTNMGHEWPKLSNGNDINAANVIWDFLKMYDINGRINE